MQKTTIIALTLFLWSLTLPSYAEKVPWNVMDNHFLIQMPYGDRATVYLTQDHTLMLLPALNNKNYNRVCVGRWVFDEEKQEMKISQSNKCRFMNGIYRVSRQGDSIRLSSPGRDLIFQIF